MQLDRDIFRQVATMRLTSPQLADGPLQGDRRSPRKGRGVEFADYRPYTPGDDLRLVDWNVFGRLELLLVRLFHEDLNMAIKVFVDASASMDFGEPRKADHAASLAACVALVGLLNQDTVTLGCLGGDGPKSEARGQNSRAFGHMLALLEQVEPAGQVPIYKELQARAGRRKKADRTFLVSDMLQPQEEVERTLRVLAATSQAPVLLHVLSPEELEPDLSDMQRVTDSETGEEILITGGREAEEQYQTILDEWLQLLRGRCRRLGIQYLPISTKESVADALLGLMRRAGVTQSAVGAA